MAGTMNEHEDRMLPPWQDHYLSGLAAWPPGVREEVAWAAVLWLGEALHWYRAAVWTYYAKIGWVRANRMHRPEPLRIRRGDLGFDLAIPDYPLLGRESLGDCVEGVVRAVGRVIDVLESEESRRVLRLMVAARHSA
jgi:hypothetical protein